jgi:hypothetical protein
MKKERIFSVMLICLLALGSLIGISCTTFQISGMEVPQRTSSSDVIGNFDINVNVTKFLGSSAGPNLFNVTSDATDPIIVDAIKREIEKLGGSKAINVNIEYQATFVHILLNMLTGSIYAPAIAHVTGTVIR